MPLQRTFDVNETVHGCASRIPPELKVVESNRNMLILVFVSEAGDKKCCPLRNLAKWREIELLHCRLRNLPFSTEYLKEIRLSVIQMIKRDYWSCSSTGIFLLYSYFI